MECVKCWNQYRKPEPSHGSSSPEEDEKTPVENLLCHLVVFNRSLDFDSSDRSTTA